MAFGDADDGGDGALEAPPSASALSEDSAGTVALNGETGGAAGACGGDGDAPGATPTIVFLPKLAPGFAPGEPKPPAEGVPGDRLPVDGVPGDRFPADGVPCPADGAPGEKGPAGESGVAGAPNVSGGSYVPLSPTPTIVDLRFCVTAARDAGPGTPGRAGSVAALPPGGAAAGGDPAAPCT